MNHKPLVRDGKIEPIGRCVIPDEIKSGTGGEIKESGVNCIGAEIRMEFWRELQGGKALSFAQSNALQVSPTRAKIYKLFLRSTVLGIEYELLARTFCGERGEVAFLGWLARSARNQTCGALAPIRLLRIDRELKRRSVSL